MYKTLLKTKVISTFHTKTFYKSCMVFYLKYLPPVTKFGQSLNRFLSIDGNFSMILSNLESGYLFLNFTRNGQYTAVLMLCFIK